MELSLEEDGAKCVVRVSGRVTVETVTELRNLLKSLTERNYAELELNLEEVPFVDTSGLGVLLGARNELRRNGTILSVSHPQERVLAVMKLTKMGDLFGLKD